jgi:ubiquinone/menaquinone biosynthesis C-methylase UbiE
MIASAPSRRPFGLFQFAPMKPKPKIGKHSPPPVASKKPSGPATQWSGAADWYDQHVGESGGEYHREIVLPGTIRLLAAAPGERALDLACGQGVLCRLLASKGIDATGVDAAPELIQAARNRGGGEGTTDASLLHYHVGDARDLTFLPADHFDAAACILAIQNIHPVAPVFASAARALKPGGNMVLVMMHPCFRGPKETRWGWDEKETVQFRRVDRYLLPRKAPIVTNPGIDAGKYTWTFHKPIEAYVKGLRNAGLLVDAMEEWASHKKSTSGPRAAAENLAREEIPMFMAIRAVKIGARSQLDLK